MTPPPPLEDEALLLLAEDDEALLLLAEDDALLVPALPALDCAVALVSADVVMPVVPPAPVAGTPDVTLVAPPPAPSDDVDESPTVSSTQAPRLTPSTPPTARSKDRRLIRRGYTSAPILPDFRGQAWRRTRRWLPQDGPHARAPGVARKQSRRRFVMVRKAGKVAGDTEKSEAKPARGGVRTEPRHTGARSRDPSIAASR